MASKAGKPAQSDSAQALAAQGNNGALAVPDEFEAFLASGNSDFSQQDLSVPFIRIVQALSPCLQPGDAKYDPDARQGQIIETVTPKTYDGQDGLLIIPVFYTRSYTEWAPNRGGLVKDHGADPTIMTKSEKVVDKDGKTKMITPDGNELSEAAQYFVLFNTGEEGFWDQAMLTMSGTQWRAARDWNSNMAKLRLTNSQGNLISNPLPFAGCYHFTTASQKKDNYNFFGWNIKLHKLTHELARGSDLIRHAAAFRKLATEGKVKGADDTVAGGDDIPGFDSPM